MGKIFSVLIQRFKENFILFILVISIGLFSNCNSSKNQSSIIGNVQGLPSDVEGLAVITSENNLSELQAVPIRNGKFAYNEAKLGQSYEIKLEIPGYFVDRSITSMAGGELDIQVKPLQIDEDTFYYRWHENQSVSGLEYSSAINEEVKVEVLGEEQTLVDNATSQKLYDAYGITLSNEELYWSSEHSHRLYDTMLKFPVNNLRRDSIWTLTNEAIHNDIEINNNRIRISNATFSYANPLIVKANGKKGRFFSKRLHHALVRFITNNGENESMVNSIMEARFGVRIIIQDEEYPNITGPTGNEHHSRFQKFNARELLIIINQFEEMPEGMHRIEELRYLLRRANGQKHPLYPAAAAVAWTHAGYIEFMESAFFPGNLEHTQRLVIHEKSHFLWEHRFSDTVKNEWIEIGGWFSTGEEPSEIWYTSKTTEFVSAYSHSENPNEDMAESISYFVINPDGLRSRSPAKYQFIRDYIMGGDFYVSKIRDDVTFTVYNLFPDYVYPGKIETVEITAEGGPEEDKKITVILHLNRQTGSDFEKASRAYARVFSEIDTFEEINFKPVDENGNKIESSYILKSEFELSKHAKNGYWNPVQIEITDGTGNKRYERTNHFGWKLYINNALEDILPPEYVANSIELKLSDIKDCTSETFENIIDKSECLPGEQLSILAATWDVNENIGIATGRNDYPCFTAFVREKDGERIDENTYSLQIHGKYTEYSSTQGNGATGQCTVNLPIADYFPHGSLTVSSISIKDLALNERRTDFNHDADHEDPHTPIDIFFTSRPDETEPILLSAVGDIKIEAVPTNPEQPNGETVVTISYVVFDPPSANNKPGSGYDIMRVFLRDPQGKSHAYTDTEPPNYFTLFFTGDPAEQKNYEMMFTLPIGSAPGLWGITRIVLADKAGNVSEYDFTQLVRFSVSDN